MFAVALVTLCVDSEDHEIRSSCSVWPSLSYILSLVIAQTLHQDQGDSAVWVLGLGRHPRLEDPMSGCGLGSLTVTPWAQSSLQWKVGWLKEATCHLTLRTIIPLGNLIDVFSLGFPG